VGGERCEGSTVVRCLEDDSGLHCSRFGCPVACVVANEQGVDRAFCAASADPDPDCAGTSQGVQRCAGNRPIQCRSGYREHEYDDCGARHCVEAVAPDCAMSPDPDPACAARLEPGGPCERAPGSCSFCDGSTLVSCRDGYRITEQDCGSLDLCHTFDEEVPGVAGWKSATCIKSTTVDAICSAARPATGARFAACNGTKLMLCVEDYLISTVECAPGSCVDTGPGWCE